MVVCHEDLLINVRNIMKLNQNALNSASFIRISFNPKLYRPNNRPKGSPYKQNTQFHSKST